LVISLVIAVALSTNDAGKPAVPDVYRMKDWATCRDGTQEYARNAQFPLEPPSVTPCAAHGGVRAYGPGKRLNEQ
jgi:hypothetical protein